MSRAVRERLNDITDAIGACYDYEVSLESGSEKTRQMALAAIERKIAIIGEASCHLPDPVTTAIPDVEWYAIRAMRNFLIHEYFGAEEQIVRNVIKNDLPILNEALTRYLASGKLEIYEAPERTRINSRTQGRASSQTRKPRGASDGGQFGPAEHTLPEEPLA